MNDTVRLPDLLYPDEDTKKLLNQRRINLAALPDNYINDVQAERLSRYFYPGNHQFSVNILARWDSNGLVIVGSPVSNFSMV